MDECKHVVPTKKKKMVSGCTWETFEIEEVSLGLGLGGGTGALDLERGTDGDNTASVPGTTSGSIASCVCFGLGLLGLEEGLGAVRGLGLLGGLVMMAGLPTAADRFNAQRSSERGCSKYEIRSSMLPNSFWGAISR